MLVHDFAYADIAFDGYTPPSILQVPGAKDVAVELYTLTKSFSMAGWRVGFLVGNAEIVQALTKLKSYLDYGTFQPIQIAAIVAMNEAPDYPKVDQRHLPVAARRPVRRPAPDRVGRHPAPGDHVRVGADPRALPGDGVARVRQVPGRRRPTWPPRPASASAPGATATCGSPSSRTSSGSARACAACARPSPGCTEPAGAALGPRDPVGPSGPLAGPAVTTSAAPKVARIRAACEVNSARLGRPRERSSSAIGWSPSTRVAPPGRPGDPLGRRRPTPSGAGRRRGTSSWGAPGRGADRTAGGHGQGQHVGAVVDEPDGGAAPLPVVARAGLVDVDGGDPLGEAPDVPTGRTGERLVDGQAVDVGADGPGGELPEPPERARRRAGRRGAGPRSSTATSW